MGLQVRTTLVLIPRSLPSHPHSTVRECVAVHAATVFAPKYSLAREIPPGPSFRKEGSIPPAAGSVTSRRAAVGSLPEMPQLKRAASPQVTALPEATA